jgi:hypothetical protein
MAAISKEQLDFAKQQYAEMKPLAQRIADQQMAAQQQQMNQAQDYYNYQQNTFRPVEQGLVRDAQRFNTEAYRNQLADQAAAASAQAFGNVQASNQRAMASMGVNPNSGRFAGINAQANLGLAAQRAGAMTGARQQAEQLGWARQMDVTGLGRNLAGASNAAYAGATGAGTAGLNTSMAPGTQYQQGLAAAGNTYGNMAQGQASMYNNSVANNPMNTMLGAATGVATSYGMKAAMSDRRLKENIELVGVDERTGLNLYEFTYKGGTDVKYRGVMADEVKGKYPEAVFTMPDGFDGVDYSAIGIEFTQV